MYLILFYPLRLMKLRDDQMTDFERKVYRISLDPIQEKPLLGRIEEKNR